MNRNKLLISLIVMLVSITTFASRGTATTTNSTTPTYYTKQVHNFDAYHSVPVQDKYRENLAYSIGIQAYIYAYPLLEVAKTMQEFTKHTPLNKFYHMRELADSNFRDVVTPNNDTLYSQAWLDLSKGPVVLSVPNVKGRYYTMQFLDAYTNSFHYIGKRTTGTTAGKYVIVGPNWKGKLPKGENIIKTPTNMVWINGRILVDGPKDLPNVHTIQDKFSLTPYDKKEAKSLLDLPTVLSTDFSDPIQFFDKMTKLIKLNPGSKADVAMISQFELIGIDPIKGFQGNIDSAVMAGLTRAVKDGKEIIAKTLSTLGKTSNNWKVFYDIGTYGTDYLKRAVVAMFGLGANVPEEAMYVRTQVDSNGNVLSGNNQYIIHFNKDQPIPPVKAFWSLSMYGPDNFFVSNPINRYSIGDRTEGLKYNPDGSLDIYIQNAPPLGHESNWLPAPANHFVLMLRMYMPEKSVLDGTYKFPLVEKVN
ncbi:DUF1254 domain-containing protein [Neobacillus sp. CF12]|uniref:DUF1254 domain-containing protein n=1 Tax=Neobacillus sp. CF12 TaxID=3055864 RepID=UPI0025A127FB|nr:DUF1254 domain-containing protein [Neobacillus sp. CF12]MDM5328239.1 DUF1254 domain-containing protein [Neobacillus sp. CF12]